METHKEIISSFRSMPKSAYESLTSQEIHMLRALWVGKFAIECSFDLNGYSLEPLYFRPADFMHREIYKNKIKPYLRKESFKEALECFVQALLSYETKNNCIYLRDLRIHNTHPILLKHIEDGFFALKIDTFLLEKISKEHAQEIHESEKKVLAEAFWHVVNTTKSF
jgi:hypothetical protein